jgi:hypothetical protein
MARSILNSFSRVELVVLGVGGMVLLTVAGVLVARRLFPRLAGSGFEPVADSLRVVYELIFALILAFVICRRAGRDGQRRVGRRIGGDDDRFAGVGQ